MRITIDKADKAFSIYIRLRDRMCMRCGSDVQFNEKGLPVSHENSHFWGRGKESTRFDEVNCCTFCSGCHMYMTANPDEHREWKLAEIGQQEYDNLRVRANTYAKKDRQLQKIYWVQKLQQDFGLKIK